MLLNLILKNKDKWKLNLTTFVWKSLNVIVYVRQIDLNLSYTINFVIKSVLTLSPKNNTNYEFENLKFAAKINEFNVKIYLENRWTNLQTLTKPFIFRAKSSQKFSVRKLRHLLSCYLWRKMLCRKKKNILHNRYRGIC